MSALNNAIAFAKSRNVVLSPDFYGLENSRHRANSFTISGNIPIDVIQSVKQSLDRALERGVTFAQWKKLAGRSTGLPSYRLETIFRNYLQSSYQAGRCKPIQNAKINRPFLMYIAVNDNRTRPSHAARHGTILPIDDPWWNDGNMPIISHGCRCTTIQLTQAQAEARGGVTQNPINPFDDGDFGINVCNEGSEEITRRSLRSKIDSCDLGANSIWCGDNGLADSMQSSLETLENWAVPSILATQIISSFQTKQDAIELQASLLGINPALAVVIDEYITTQHKKSDNASRQASRGNVANEDMGLLNSLIDQAFDESDLVEGTFYLRLPDIGLGLIDKARKGKPFRLETFLNLFDIPEDLTQSKGDIVLVVKTDQAMRLINGQYMVKRGTKFSIDDSSTSTVLVLTSTTEPDIDVQSLGDIEQGDEANRLGISQAM